MRVTVVVTSFEDARVEDAVASLQGQKREPFEVIVADGSRESGFLSWLQAWGEQEGVVLVHEEGASVARARNLAIEEARGDVLAFLDTDQWAPPEWLARLVAPIEAGRVHWTGGPTRPLAEMALVSLKEARLYEAAAMDPTRIPMGNSAWSTRVFETVGGFDERLSRGGEDWDVALRARDAGFEGELVEDAWVEHDLSGLDSYGKVAKKQFRYNVGGAMAYMKNKTLAERATRRYPRVEGHWFDAVDWVLKGLAVPVAWWRLRRAE